MLSDYLQDEYYLSPIDIVEKTLEFIDINDLSSEDLDKLAKVYLNAFNKNNATIKEKYNIGKGFWHEPIWTLKSASQRIIELKDAHTLVAVARNEDDKKVVIGASSYEIQTYDQLLDRWKWSSGDKNFKLSAVLSDVKTIIYEKDIFKRPVNNENNQKITGIASNLKTKNEERILHKVDHPVAFLGTTRNKQMKNVWINSGYDVSDFSFYDGTDGWSCLKVIR